jgi:hypothetical protein
MISMLVDICWSGFDERRAVLLIEGENERCGGKRSAPEIQPAFVRMLPAIHAALRMS